MKFIDIDDVREDILGVIAIKGDKFEYTPPNGNDCMYIDGGAPSCMVGYYLLEKGVPKEVLEENNTESIGKLIHHKMLPDLLFSNDARMALINLQEYQDAGYSWGRAYRMTFEEEYE